MDVTTKDHTREIELLRQIGDHAAVCLPILPNHSKTLALKLFKKLSLAGYTRRRSRLPTLPASYKEGNERARNIQSHETRRDETRGATRPAVHRCDIAGFTYDCATGYDDSTNSMRRASEDMERRAPQVR